jgi:hypothetical protein
MFNLTFHFCFKVFTLAIRKGLLRKTPRVHFPFTINSSSCGFSPQAHLGIEMPFWKSNEKLMTNFS